MAARTRTETRNLFWLLTRSDATLFPDDETQMGLRNFVLNAVHSYWDAFIDYKIWDTFTLAADSNLTEVSFSSNVLDVEDLFLYEHDNYPTALSANDLNERRQTVERVEFHEIRRRQRNDDTRSTANPPNAWCAVRKISSNNSWTIHTHPWSTIDILIEIHYRGGFPQQAGSGSEAPYSALTDAEFFWCVQMAAAKAALTIGRKEDVPLILQGVPDPVLLRSDIALYEAIPSLRPSETILGR